MVSRRFSILIMAAIVACQVKAVGSVSDKLTPEAIEARIREHRMGELVIKTKPGAEVRVEQLRHELWFGTAVSNSLVPGSSRRRMADADREKYLEVLAANFNAAVHENALKWHNCERTPTGGFDYSTAEGIYKLCADRDIVMRGHCMFWCTDRNVQGWVKQLDKDDLRKVVKRRAMDVTSRFKGRIEEFDLNNELIFGNFYRRNLGDGIIKDMADWGKQGNPKALLYLNEQGSLASGGRNADKYIALIKKMLDAGVRIDGLGCQGHFGGGMFDPEKVQRTLDRLGQFNLPIKITEYDLNSGDQQLKERHLRDFYTICFAHPAVEGIMMWGFWEGAHWRPKAALWKRDWTLTPTAETYRDLVFKKWWTKKTGRADGDGTYRTRAFYGKYTIESAGKKQQLTLQKHKGIETLTFSH
ncbi:MAG: endo-1,4-beta-xylanase [Phycisphaerae bacterium]|nr:endo-1,4-beta-xylanase [Phycisphaerae bacterium]